MTVMLYAQRKEIPLESVDVDVVRDAGEERKGIYRLTAKLTLHGPLSDAQIDELFSVAEKCPVHKLMTAVDVQVSTLVVRPACRGGAAPPAAAQPSIPAGTEEKPAPTGEVWPR